MPLITRTLIKTSLVYLALALLLGAVLVAAPLFNFSLPPGFTPLFFHLFMVGWVSQLIFGVAVWMFPKFSMQQPRGDERLIWVAFGLLNIGLSLRMIGEPMQSFAPMPVWGWFLAVSAAAQWLAGLGFGWNFWTRVKEK
jgi:hypothetical protein